MQKNHLTHSSHSLQWKLQNIPKYLTDAVGGECPYVYLVELDKQIQKRIDSFAADRGIKLKSKANDYVEVQENILAIQYNKSRTPHWFVTVNPKSETTLEKLHDKIVEVLSHPDVKNPYWSYEIRKLPDQGLHAHIYFEYHGTDKNFGERKIKAPFVPDICGTKKHIYLKWVTSEEVHKVKSYIAKSDVSKSKKSKNDATLTWREENAIPDTLDSDHLLVWSELSSLEDTDPPLAIEYAVPTP